MSTSPVAAELRADARAERAIVEQLEVRVLGLLVRRLVGDEVRPRTSPCGPCRRAASAGRPTGSRGGRRRTRDARGRLAGRRASSAAKSARPRTAAPSTSKASGSPAASTGTQPWKMTFSSRTASIAPRSSTKRMSRQRDALSRKLLRRSVDAPALVRPRARTGRGSRRWAARGRAAGAPCRRCVTVPAAGSMRCSRLRCSRSKAGLRRVVWPSSLNWRIAAAFCMRARSSGSRRSSPLERKRSAGSSP